MAAFVDTQKSNPGVHVKARKQALGELRDVMAKAAKGARAGKATPESGEHAPAAFSVTRKAKTGPSLPTAKPLSLHEETKGDFEGFAHEAAETPDFEHSEDTTNENDDAEMSIHADRANPGNAEVSAKRPGHHDILSDPKKVDAALSHYMVKPKKHKSSF